MPPDRAAALALDLARTTEAVRRAVHLLETGHADAARRVLRGAVPCPKPDREAPPFPPFPASRDPLNPDWHGG
jgi:hypothetical protein